MTIRYTPAQKHMTVHGRRWRLVWGPQGDQVSAHLGHLHVGAYRQCDGSIHAMGYGYDVVTPADYTRHPTALHTELHCAIIGSSRALSVMLGE